MARSRNIKPGFFTNEDLVELDFATRLLFAGLWTIADKAGRLEDRPRKIKMAIFPADNVDVDVMLDELNGYGFILRYEINGEKYVQVQAWSKHQNPHHTEKASIIPGPNGDLTVKDALEHDQDQLQDGEYLADSLLLIPDSLITSSPAKLPTCPHDILIDLFAKHLPTLPRPKKELWAGKNAEATRARWKFVLTATKESGDRYATTQDEAVSWFDRFFAHVAKSDFLSGTSGKWTGCDMGWLMKSENFTKVIQGNYDNKGQA